MSFVNTLEVTYLWTYEEILIEKPQNVILSSFDTVGLCHFESMRPRGHGPFSALVSKKHERHAIFSLSNETDAAWFWNFCDASSATAAIFDDDRIQKFHETSSNLAL